MNRMRGIKIGLVILGSVLLLSGCKTKEEKIVEQEKEQFNLLYDYETDKLRPVITKEKTPEQLIQDIVMEELGLNTGGRKYKEHGVLKGQGIFIESAIRDGTSIPNVSAIPYVDRVTERDYTEETEQEKKALFAKLMAQRETILQGQYDDEDKTRQTLIAELEKRIEDQENGVSGPGKDDDSWGDGNGTYSEGIELEALKREAKEEMERKKAADKEREDERKKKEAELKQQKDEKERKKKEAAEEAEKAKKQAAEDAGN